MRSRMTCECVALLLGLVTSPNLAAAQTQGTPTAAQTPDAEPAAQASAATLPPEAPIDAELPVLQYDLSGPRLGATFAPDGTARSQFGWHLEHQAAPGTRGPWFIVEKVFLVGGMESDAFIPSGTLIFGLRLPNSFEFGVGPSATLGGSSFLNTAIVVAAGHSFRVGGIRIPVNLALAVERRGENRLSLVTGWAIREPARSR
ncbi:MAG TPA: hypothetical protein VEY91_13155 [Candidatus Limnocylindria bacterium]|nr:hypothetical protein [Candidatus Limnocylindria bacterium]